MAKPEWGVKRICPSCGTRYYDMHKDPATCPKCGVEYDPEALLRSRRARPVAVEEPVRKVAVVDEDVDQVEETETEDLEEDTDIEAAEEDEEDVVLEDADDLGGDDMDVVDVEGEDEER